MRITLSELPIWRSVLVLLIVMTSTRASELREIRGRVVDERGQSVADAVVDVFWRANGTGKDRDGKYLDVKIEENLKEFWGHLGEMKPLGPGFATTGSDGRFTVTIPTSKHAVMAMDRRRQRGGLLVLPKGKEQELMEIRIGPLIKVRGSLRGPGVDEKPGWTHVYLICPTTSRDLSIRRDSSVAARWIPGSRCRCRQVGIFSRVITRRRTRIWSRPRRSISPSEELRSTTASSCCRTPKASPR